MKRIFQKVAKCFLRIFLINASCCIFDKYKRDWIFEELLYMLSGLQETGKFLERMMVRKVDKETVGSLVKVL